LPSTGHYQWLQPYLQAHPGGAKIILKYAGKDATSAYEPIHPTDALDKNLEPDKHLGTLVNDDAAAIEEAKRSRKKTRDELRMEKAMRERPPLRRVLDLQEMEVSVVFSYYSTT
jgi:L-lactate dehydrogenase (cytochrome)